MWDMKHIWFDEMNNHSLDDKNDIWYWSPNSYWLKIIPSVLCQWGCIWASCFLELPSNWLFVQKLFMLTKQNIKFPSYILSFNYQCYDDVIKWKLFPRDWPFVREIHRSPVSCPHKGQGCGALMFSLFCAWINDWVNNGEAGDLRRHSNVIFKRRRLFCIENKSGFNSEYHCAT